MLACKLLTKSRSKKTRKSSGFPLQAFKRQAFIVNRKMCFYAECCNPRGRSLQPQIHHTWTCKTPRSRSVLDATVVYRQNCQHTCRLSLSSYCKVASQLSDKPTGQQPAARECLKLFYAFYSARFVCNRPRNNVYSYYSENTKCSVKDQSAVPRTD